MSERYEQLEGGEMAELRDPLGRVSDETVQAEIDALPQEIRESILEHQANLEY